MDLADAPRSLVAGIFPEKGSSRECRLLLCRVEPRPHASGGGRTNPRFRECGPPWPRRSSNPTPRAAAVSRSTCGRAFSTCAGVRTARPATKPTRRCLALPRRPRVVTARCRGGDADGDDAQAGQRGDRSGLVCRGEGRVIDVASLMDKLADARPETMVSVAVLVVVASQLPGSKSTGALEILADLLGKPWPMLQSDVRQACREILHLALDDTPRQDGGPL